MCSRSMHNHLNLSFRNNQEHVDAARQQRVSQSLKTNASVVEITGGVIQSVKRGRRPTIYQYSRHVPMGRLFSALVRALGGMLPSQSSNFIPFSLSWFERNPQMGSHLLEVTIHGHSFFRNARSSVLHSMREPKAILIDISRDRRTPLSRNGGYSPW